MILNNRLLHENCYSGFKNHFSLIVWGSLRHHPGEFYQPWSLRRNQSNPRPTWSTDEREGEGQFSEGKFVVLRIKNFDNFTKLPLMGFVFKKVVFKLSFWLQTPFSTVFNLGKKSIDNLQFSHLHFHYVAQGRLWRTCPNSNLIPHGHTTGQTACRS